MWSAEVQLHSKLYGRKEEPEKTATFILRIGLTLNVAAMEKKKKSPSKWLLALLPIRRVDVVYVARTDLSVCLP